MKPALPTGTQVRDQQTGRIYVKRTPHRTCALWTATVREQDILLSDCRVRVGKRFELVN